jgi:hypothetical protein
MSMQLQGLISAALLQRLGGVGALVHLHLGDQPQAIPCVHAMNFDEQVRL